MYEMTAGVLPFPSDYEQALFYGILNEQPEPLTGLRTGVPMELERIAMKCLAKEAGQRYQSCTDLLVDLRALEKALGSGSAQTASSSEAKPAAPVAAPADPAQRGLALPVVGAIAAASALVGGGLAWFTAHPAQSDGWPPEYTVEQLTWDSGLSIFPALSADGSLVAYASDRDGGGHFDIWVQQTNGGGSVQLTDSPLEEWTPAFSPDGSTIAFTRGAGLYVIPSLGGSARLFAKSGMLPSYSPDGKLLAYKNSDQRAVVQAVDGAEPRVLGEDLYIWTIPNWSPDGRHISFMGIQGSESSDYEYWAVPVDGGAPIVTGLSRLVEEAGIHNLSGSMNWLVPGQELLFASFGNLLKLDFSSETWDGSGPPKMVTFGPAKLETPSVSRDGTIAVHAARRRTDVWRIPRGDLADAAFDWTLDPDTEAYYPNLSADQTKLLYIAQAGEKINVQLRDLLTGQDRKVSDDRLVHRSAAISRDGSLVAFQSLDGQDESLHVYSVDSGETRKVCDDCGRPKSWSMDNSKLLVEAGIPNVTRLVETESGQSTTILQQPELAIHDPQFSPDGQWIVFKANLGPGRARVFVAPNRGPEPILREDWIAISSEQWYDKKPRWSPEGDRIYFLSDRDSQTGLWSVEWNPRRGRVSSEPELARVFDDARHSLRDLQGHEIGYDVGREYVYFTLRETTGQIFLLRPNEDGN